MSKTSIYKLCRADAEKLRWKEEIELFYGRSRGAELELESTPGSRPWSRLQPPGSKAVGGRGGQLVALGNRQRGGSCTLASFPPSVVPAVTAGGPDIWGWLGHEGAEQVREEGRLRSLPALCAIQLQGTLRLILEPLLVDKPFVGAVTMFFLQKPVSPQDEAGLPLPVGRRSPTGPRYTFFCIHSPPQR